MEKTAKYNLRIAIRARIILMIVLSLLLLIIVMARAGEFNRQLAEEKAKAMNAMTWNTTEVKRIHHENVQAIQDQFEDVQSMDLQFHLDSQYSNEVETVEEVEEVTPEVIVEEPEPMLSAYGPGEVEYYHISYYDKVLIAKVVWAEARGECFEGQVAVAATVLNRFTSDDSAIHNNSIEAVVTQPWAYAPIDDVTYEDAMQVMKAVEEACMGYDPTRLVFPNGARFFYAQDWISEEELAKRDGVDKLVIENHTFHDEFAPQN